MARRSRWAGAAGIMLLGVVVPLRAQTPGTPAAAPRVAVARGWAVAPGAAVRIMNFSGSTRVIGWEHDSVDVRGTISASGRLVSGGGRQGAKVAVEPAAGAGDPPPADLEIRVPRTALVWLKVLDGAAEVRELDGVVEVFSLSGRVIAAGAPRQLTIESMTGAVQVTGHPSVLRVRGAGAPVSVRGGGPDMHVETVTGEIVIDAGAPRRVRLESTAGPVTFRGGLAADATLDVQTHEAPVRLTLPAAIRAEFELTTFDGLLVNRFGTEAARPSRGGKPLRFTVNGGGARVTVRTLKGNVEVYRR